MVAGAEGVDPVVANLLLKLPEHLLQVGGAFRCFTPGIRLADRGKVEVRLVRGGVALLVRHRHVQCGQRVHELRWRGHDVFGHRAGVAAQRCVHQCDDVHRVRALAQGVTVRRDVGKRRAYLHQHIGVVQQARDVLVAAVAQPTGVGGSGKRDAVRCAPVVHHRNVVGVRELGEFARGLLVPPGATCVDQRPFRGSKLLFDGVPLPLRRPSPRHRAGRIHSAFELFVEHIFRQTDHYRSGAAGGSLEERVGHDAGCGRRVVQNEHLLGLRPKPRLRVELLEGLAVPVRKRDQADKQHHRGAVLPRGVNGHESV